MRYLWAVAAVTLHTNFSVHVWVIKPQSSAGDATDAITYAMC